MIICIHRSNPQSPSRLRATPLTRPDAANNGDGTDKKRITAKSTQSCCQLINQKPALTGPTMDEARGAIHVANISNATDNVWITPTCDELYPMDRR